jgi:hypothetical protein
MIGSIRHCAENPAWFVTAGIALLVTPVCGWLFNCGCDWPWLGLATHCNYFDATATLRCPWCEHPLSSMIGIILASMAGIAAARQTRTLRHSPRSAGSALLGLAIALAGLLVAGAATFWLTGKSVS